MLEGEAVVLGVDGVSDFDDLVCRMHDDEVRLYAFDLHAWRARPTARVTADVADARPAQIPKAIHHGHPSI